MLRSQPTEGPLRSQPALEFRSLKHPAEFVRSTVNVDMQCSTAAFTARETRALRTWAALLFLACAQVWCGNLREHHRAWSRAHYPTSLASSFDTIPCSYANAIGGTHSTPNDGPVHNGSASPAAEELLRFVD